MYHQHQHIYPSPPPYPGGMMAPPPYSPRPMQCYTCGEMGHTSRMCPRRPSNFIPGAMPTTPTGVPVNPASPATPQTPTPDCTTCKTRRRKKGKRSASPVSVSSDDDDHVDVTRPSASADARHVLRCAQLLKPESDGQPSSTPWSCTSRPPARTAPFEVHRALLAAIDAGANDEPSVPAYREAILRACAKTDTA